MNGLTIPVDADKLRSVRTGLGLKQKWVAEQIGISKQALSTYERGDALPSLETVERLCEVYKCTVSELVNVRDITTVLDAINRVGKLYGLEIKVA